jgi:hypothetical protein
MRKLFYAISTKQEERPVEDQKEVVVRVLFPVCNHRYAERSLPQIRKVGAQSTCHT